MTPLFHLENIVRTYPDPASRDPHAVRTVLNLSELDIRAGEILGIRGHNGSGTSTLLRIIAGVEPPSSGRVSALLSTRRLPSAAPRVVAMRIAPTALRP